MIKYEKKGCMTPPGPPPCIISTPLRAARSKKWRFSPSNISHLLSGQKPPGAPSIY